MERLGWRTIRPPKARGMRVYEAYRARGRMKDGRRFGPPPNPRQAPNIPTATVNVTDPDTQLMKGMRNYVQGYNAQAVVNERQIVLAAEITNHPGDFSHLRPMIQSMSHELKSTGVTDRPELVVADAGYWNVEHINHVIGNEHLQVLIPPDSGKRKGARQGWTGGLFDWMRHALDTDHGRVLYRQRRETIEPIFGHTKHNRGFTRFHRRGRLAVRTEWRLMMSTHATACPPVVAKTRCEASGGGAAQRSLACCWTSASRVPWLAYSPVCT
jgi:hypothetical protein